jgi:hypothetical protein
MMTCKHYGCELPAEEGKKQCSPHLEQARKYQSERRSALLSEGKCARCAGSSRPGKTMCQSCADTWNNYLKTRRAGG